VTLWFLVRGDVLPACYEVKNIPSGTEVHCVESIQQGCSFGDLPSGDVVQGIDPSGKFVQIKMPSGEIRWYFRLYGILDR
jgi:ribosomal protein L2